MVREPGASPGRSRRCEGRCPSPHATERDSGRRRRGSPESEDLPAVLHTEPLAEGGFVAKRLVVLIVVLLFAVPAVACAATVKVRVEGKTKNLFGPQEITVTASNAMEAIQQAAVLGEFYYHVT